MKKAKRILAVFMSLTIAMSVMIAMSATSFAADEKPAGALTLDPKISVTGLTDGDQVSFYKILKWDNGWKLENGVNLTEDEVKAIVGDKTTPGAVKSDVALKLAKEPGTAKYGPLTAKEGKVEQASPEAGLYMALITPKDPKTTYNPVFVGADYKQGEPDSSTWNVTTQLSYSDNALAKKSSTDLEKTSTKLTANVGDKVPFEVTTTIPSFGDKYVEPVFKVTDSLSQGLELDADTITLAAPTGLTKDTDYTITPDGKTGYTLAFSYAYLKTVTTPTAVTITYAATLTSEAPFNVNQEDNTVTVHYSNNPSDTEGKGVMKDKTNHYTFDIDGNLFGEQPYKATEVVKVGIDKNGNEIKETVELDNGNKVGALQGAEFRLYTDEACKKEYSNPVFQNPITTDAQGRMTIKGLDAGTYWVKETKAPAGYIADQNPHSIEITAKMGEKEITETVEGQEVTYKTNVLESYTVKIDGETTATYTITNNASTTKIESVDKGDTVVGTDANKGKIKNTQGTELPSTGGIGTVIFYVLGSILVISSAIILISKRRLESR